MREGRWEKRQRIRMVPVILHGEVMETLLSMWETTFLPAAFDCLAEIQPVGYQSPDLEPEPTQQQGAQQPVKMDLTDNRPDFDTYNADPNNP